jgi:hypothetical protein
MITVKYLTNYCHIVHVYGGPNLAQIMTGAQTEARRWSSDRGRVVEWSSDRWTLGILDHWDKLDWSHDQRLVWSIDTCRWTSVGGLTSGQLDGVS